MEVIDFVLPPLLLARHSLIRWTLFGNPEISIDLALLVTNLVFVFLVSLHIKLFQISATNQVKFTLEVIS